MGRRSVSWTSTRTVNVNGLPRVPAAGLVILISTACTGAGEANQRVVRKAATRNNTSAPRYTNDGVSFDIENLLSPPAFSFFLILAMSTGVLPARVISSSLFVFKTSARRIIIRVVGGGMTPFSILLRYVASTPTPAAISCWVRPAFSLSDLRFAPQACPALALSAPAISAGTLPESLRSSWPSASSAPARRTNICSLGGGTRQFSSLLI